MILVDFSAIMFQNIFGAAKSTGKENLNELTKNITGSILYTLTFYQKMFKEYGDLIICLDSHTKNWRKDILKTYKSSRKENREQSDIPFNEIFEAVNEFLDQLRKNSPWKVVLVKGAEGDDVILCLAQFFAKTEKVLILSSDKDMIQAQKNKNVKQFSALTKKFITPETKSDNLDDWIQEHIILGDTADEVPRITDKTEFSDSFKEYLKSLNLDLNPKNFLELTEIEQAQIEESFDILDKKGQKDIWKNIKLGPKKIQKMIANNELEAFLDSNELYRKNYERNKILVLQEYIPTEIYNSIILCLKTQEKDNINISEFKNYLYNLGLVNMAENLPDNFKSKNISIDDIL